jgi:beta-galactosidase
VEYKIHSERFIGPLTATQYADWTTGKNAEVLAAYDQWPVESFAAVTRNKYGKGAGWYVGTIIKEENFYAQLIEKLLADASIKSVLKPPAGVEFSVREGNGKKLLFIINHTEQKQIVPVPKGATELLSRTETSDKLELDILGVAVLELK